VQEGALSREAICAALAGQPWEGPEADVTGLMREWAVLMPVQLLQQSPSLRSGEATPSYLLDGEMCAQRMKVLAPNARLLIILRDPVERCWSHHRMCIDSNGNAAQLANRGIEFVNPDFEFEVNKDIDSLETAGVLQPELSFTDAAAAFSQRWLTSEEAGMTHGGHSFVARGLYAYQATNQP